MLLILIVGLFTLIFGGLFLFAPNLLRKWNEIGNTLISTDEKTLTYRVFTGILLMAISGILIYIAIGLYFQSL